jgi:hypothetical protein
VKTYDPADRIIDVQMTRPVDPYSILLEGGRRCIKLPAKYANRSQCTCLTTMGAEMTDHCDRPSARQARRQLASGEPEGRRSRSVIPQAANSPGSGHESCSALRRQRWRAGPPA